MYADQVLPTPPLPLGIYEALVTRAVDAQLAATRAAGLHAEAAAPDAAVRPELLARHAYDELVRKLDTLPPERHAELLDRVLETLRTFEGDGEIDRVGDDPRVLLSVLPPTTPTPPRPHLSLRRSALLVNGHRDYALAPELRRELASADRVDLLCAFVRYSGLRLVRDELEALVRRGGRLRVIASVYTGTTERKALDLLLGLGAEVRVSYETEQTRLHAKAWLLHRDSGFSTAYVGSSNLTHTALVEGLEWNVRLSRVDNPEMIDRFASAFEQYWAEPEFAPYSAVDGDRLQRALDRQRGGASAPEDVLAGLNIDVEPKPHQRDILQKLEEERVRGHTRNLVVAATGTGKTWVAGFDYRRLRQAGHDRLLFVAHRREILDQSRRVFQVILRESGFGELFVDGERPAEHRHVFASIQSLDRAADALAPDAFDVVIVDEFHHSAAPTYARLLERLRPRVLLGLTATPERPDGAPILDWFGGRVAAELRLWDALDQQLLCPFHYFGINDDTDLSAVTFKRGRYDAGELGRLYTGDDVRATRVLQAAERVLGGLGGMRALGFCVGVQHAALMARWCSERGVPSVALTGDDDAATRRDAIARLRRGELRAIFTVDLFNEGVDIPEVDTLLLLRPTESATVFLQQLGRGMRRADGKSVLTVLDFIGQANRQYRFDVRYRALIGGTRRQVERAVEQDFPLLPPGCAITLDRIAKEHVLANLRQATQRVRRDLLDDLRPLGPDATLATFLAESERDLSEVYPRTDGSATFTSLRRELGFERRPPHEHEKHLGGAMARMLHVDDDLRLGTWTRWLERDAPPVLDPDARDEASERDRRLALMLFAAIGNRRRPIAELDKELRDLWAAAPLREELLAVLRLLDDRRRARTEPLRATVAPLASHATYRREEVIAAMKVVTKRGLLLELQQGVLWVQDAATDVFFVTFEKSEAAFSPTTRYRDYPISPTLFHWESQTNASAATLDRYLNHVARGTRVLLFARERPDDDRGETAPYTCLGYARYVRHAGARPMAITWELERGMPGWLFQAGKVAAG